MPAFYIDSIDDPLLTEICEIFLKGQNSNTRASLLQEGEAIELTNVILLPNGEISKRRGTRDVFAGFVSNEFDRIQALVNYDTVSVTLLVVIVDGRAKYFDGVSWQSYFDAQIVDPNELIDLVQLTDELYWSDSNEAGGISNWDGISVSVIAGSPANVTVLEVITNRLAAAGTADVPDAVYFSDILDPLTWDLVNNQVRIGAGDGEPIVALKAWQENNLLVFKRRGVWVINCDPTQATAASFAIAKIHNTIGCVSRRSVCQVGQDVWFLSRNGVMSVQKQIGTSSNLIALPMSQQIQDIILKIRWPYAYKSAAACYNNYYLLSVPVDSNEPDTVLVFHYQTGGWTIFKGWDACTFLEQPHEGLTRLLMGCVNGEVREWLDYLDDDEIEPSLDFRDGLQGVTLPQTLSFTFPPGRDTVATIETRGMVFGEPLNPKSGFYGSIEVLQQDGTVSVSIVRDGQDPELVMEFETAAAGFTFPTTFPITLPMQPGYVSKTFPLNDITHGVQFTELRYRIVSDSGNFAMRRAVAQAFLDTLDFVQR